MTLMLLIYTDELFLILWNADDADVADLR